VTGKSADLQWRRSTYCGNAACLEYADSGKHVFVRDAKDVDGPVLAFAPKEWNRFVRAAVAKEFSALPR
jgi:hypothetical protein